MRKERVGFAMCGSFCTHHRAMEALEAVKARYDHVIPIVSEVVADTDTRFGTAHDLMREMERICALKISPINVSVHATDPAVRRLLELQLLFPAGWQQRFQLSAPF